jgi:hypothetical protein
VAALPPGVTLNADTGALGGTPTSFGSYTFVVKADNQNGCVATRSYTLNINANTDFGDSSGFPSASVVANATRKIGSVRA